VRKADNLTTILCRCHEIWGNLTSWNPLGHSRPVTGLIYLYLLRISVRGWVDPRAIVQPEGLCHRKIAMRSPGRIPSKNFFLISSTAALGFAHRLSYKQCGLLARLRSRVNLKFHLAPKFKAAKLLFQYRSASCCISKLDSGTALRLCNLHTAW